MAFASVCRVTRLSRMQTIFFHRLFTRFWPQMSSGNALSTTAILNETMASNTVETGEKIYEMRTYRIKPEAFPDFMKLTDEHIHLVTAKSKMCGYWTSEIGGLNETIHISEYDSYAQRTATRNALSQDKEWLSSYLKPILKMMVKQESVVMTAVPWFDVKPPITTGGVYELRVYDIVLGKIDQWAHRLVQGFPYRCGLSEPVGIWTTEIGPIGRAVFLWPYKSLDDRVRIRKEAQQIEEWTEAVRDCLALETKASSKILIPTKFSSWK